MTQPIYLEELWTTECTYGAKINFPHNTIELKKNKNGIRGIFLSKDMSKGTEIMSVPKVGGSLTPLRAAENAREMLLPLGTQRYHLDDDFIISCAVYLECKKSSKKSKALTMSSLEMKTNYGNTPMSCWGSSELLQLTADNDSREKNKFQQFNEYMSKIDIDDENLFRASLAYTMSRRWIRIGIMPGMDLFNSSYIGTNTLFEELDNRYRFLLQKDVEAGEELTWRYNELGALRTWLTYGYFDQTRPFSAYLRYRTNENELERLENFISKTWDIPRKPENKIDPLIRELNLSSPGPALSSPEDIHSAIMESVQTFQEVRSGLRCLNLVKKEKDNGDYSQQDILGDSLNFGREFEHDVLDTMLKALSDGYKHVQDKVLAFSNSRFGTIVNVDPYTNITNTATNQWNKTLSMLKSICSAPDLASCIELINKTTGKNFDSKSNDLRGALSVAYNEQPSLNLVLATNYLSARKFIH